MKRACLLILVSVIMTGTAFAQSKQAANPYKSAQAVIEMSNGGKPIPDFTPAQVDDIMSPMALGVQLNPALRPCRDKYRAMLETPGWLNNEIAKKLSERVSDDEMDRFVAGSLIMEKQLPESELKSAFAPLYPGLSEAEIPRRFITEMNNVVTSLKLAAPDAMRIMTNYPCGGSNIERQPRSVGWNCTGAYQIIDATPDGDGQWTATYTSRTQPQGSFKINPANRNVRSCALTWVY